MRLFRSKTQLNKIDNNPISDIKDEILLFMVVRNESLRLPYIFEYYFSRGVDRIFVIDNGSTDNTIPFVLSQRNTHVFQAKEHYSYQVVWVETLLRRYGIGHWCLVVDADELLIYPHWETLVLRDLTNFLDRERYNTMQFLLLDMYSTKPIHLALYSRGTNPILTMPYFDIDSYYHHSRKWFFFRVKINLNFGDTQAKSTFRKMYKHIVDFLCRYFGNWIAGSIFGGMRMRVFGVEANLSKFSLIKFNPGIHLSGGAHTIRGARVASIRGASLHFKFFNDFPDRVKEEVGREEHWNKAFEYKCYADTIKQNPEISLYHSGSVKFTDSHQLVKLGIMKSSKKLDSFVEDSLEGKDVNENQNSSLKNYSKKSESN